MVLEKQVETKTHLMLMVRVLQSAAAAGLTGGDIALTGASVGTKQGFSIVKFTGPGSAGFQSVPHGLTKKPKFILCKDLDNARNWGVFHEDVITADTKAFILNSTSAVLLVELLAGMSLRSMLLLLPHILEMILVQVMVLITYTLPVARCLAPGKIRQF